VSRVICIIYKLELTNVEDWFLNKTQALKQLVHTWYFSVLQFKPYAYGSDMERDLQAVVDITVIMNSNIVDLVAGLRCRSSLV
jgi:hypothetical protein